MLISCQCQESSFRQGFILVGSSRAYQFSQTLSNLRQEWYRTKGVWNRHFGTYRCVVGVDETQGRWIAFLIRHGLNELKHGSDSTAASNHTDSWKLVRQPMFGHRITYQESLVSFVSDVTSKSCDPEALLSDFHLINKLRKMAGFMLKGPQVDFDQQVNVALVTDLRHWVKVALDCLSINISFKLQILACKVA